MHVILPVEMCMYIFVEASPVVVKGVKQQVRNIKRRSNGVRRDDILRTARTYE